jgi:hypothetical protein
MSLLLMQNFNWRGGKRLTESSKSAALWCKPDHSSHLGLCLEIWIEWLPGGFTLNEGKILARRLEEAGVDYLSCNAGIYESWVLSEIIKLTSRPGYQVDITRTVSN